MVGIQSCDIKSSHVAQARNELHRSLGKPPDPQAFVSPVLGAELCVTVAGLCSAAVEREGLRMAEGTHQMSYPVPKATISKPEQQQVV